jgi:hypothetical protein
VSEATDLPCERRARPETRSRAIAALERGAWHGAWTVTIGATPAALAYVVRYGEVDLPWTVLAAQFATFVPICGAFYGAGTALGAAAAANIRGSWAVRALSSILLPATFGALFGIPPGAFAAEHFGSLEAPYFGTAEIFVAGVLAFFLLGTSLLRNDGVRLLPALMALTVALVVPFLCAFAIWLAAPDTTWIADMIVIETANLAPSLAVFGASFGGVVGIVFGGLSGLSRVLLSRALPAAPRHSSANS